eukprot:TRINITY_DN4802_c0_g1_i5.p1 TRINITY_DN4802_c0_g1~~TRINITY_DN4802_c0_g1_i5.p1  ORF type:complete len:2008 (-),score=388.12 TRINITY_DN4802_c0_g1_i5:219-6242(-)
MATETSVGGLSLPRECGETVCDDGDKHAKSEHRPSEEPCGTCFMGEQELSGDSMNGVASEVASAVRGGVSGTEDFSSCFDADGLEVKAASKSGVEKAIDEGKAAQDTSSNADERGQFDLAEQDQGNDGDSCASKQLMAFPCDEVARSTDKAEEGSVEDQRAGDSKLLSCAPPFVTATSREESPSLGEAPCAAYEEQSPTACDEEMPLAREACADGEVGCSGVLHRDALQSACAQEISENPRDGGVSQPGADEDDDCICLDSDDENETSKIPPAPSVQNQVFCNVCVPRSAVSSSSRRGSPKSVTSSLVSITLDRESDTEPVLVFERADSDSDTNGCVTAPVRVPISQLHKAKLRPDGSMLLFIFRPSVSMTGLFGAPPRGATSTAPSSPLQTQQPPTPSPMPSGQSESLSMPMDVCASGEQNQEGAAALDQSKESLSLRRGTTVGTVSSTEDLPCVGTDEGGEDKPSTADTEMQEQIPCTGAALTDAAAVTDPASLGSVEGSLNTMESSICMTEPRDANMGESDGLIPSSEREGADMDKRKQTEARHKSKTAVASWGDRPTKDPPDDEHTEEMLVKAVVLIPQPGELPALLATLRQWVPHAFADEEPELPRSPGLSEPPALRLGRIELRGHDMDLLADGEFLNDTVLDFSVRLAVDVLAPPELRNSIYVASTTLFQALTSRGAETGEEGWCNVSRWTRSLEGGVLSKEYMLVPMNEGNYHWWLAVICRPRGVVANGEQRILCLDSGSDFSRKDHAMGFLRGYIRREWRERQGGEEPGKPLRAMSIRVPKQANCYDCGVFVLEYMLYLFRHPKILAGLGVRPYRPWFSQASVSLRRRRLREAIWSLALLARDREEVDVSKLIEDEEVKKFVLKALTERPKLRIRKRPISPRADSPHVSFERTGDESISRRHASDGDAVPSPAASMSEDDSVVKDPRRKIGTTDKHANGSPGLVMSHPIDDTVLDENNSKDNAQLDVQSDTLDVKMGLIGPVSPPIGADGQADPERVEESVDGCEDTNESNSPRIIEAVSTAEDDVMASKAVFASQTVGCSESSDTRFEIAPTSSLIPVEGSATADVTVSESNEGAEGCCAYAVDASDKAREDPNTSEDAVREEDLLSNVRKVADVSGGAMVVDCQGDLACPPNDSIRVATEESVGTDANVAILSVSTAPPQTSAKEGIEDVSSKSANLLLQESMCVSPCESVSMSTPHPSNDACPPNLGGESVRVDTEVENTGDCPSNIGAFSVPLDIQIDSSVGFGADGPSCPSTSGTLLAGVEVDQASFAQPESSCTPGLIEETSVNLVCEAEDPANVNSPTIDEDTRHYAVDKASCDTSLEDCRGAADPESSLRKLSAAELEGQAAALKLLGIDVPTSTIAHDFEMKDGLECPSNAEDVGSEEFLQEAGEEELIEEGEEEEVVDEGEEEEEDVMGHASYDGEEEGYESSHEEAEEEEIEEDGEEEDPVVEEIFEKMSDDERESNASGDLGPHEGDESQASAADHDDSRSDEDLPAPFSGADSEDKVVREDRRKDEMLTSGDLGAYSTNDLFSKTSVEFGESHPAVKVNADSCDALTSGVCEAQRFEEHRCVASENEDKTVRDGERTPEPFHATDGEGAADVAQLFGGQLPTTPTLSTEEPAAKRLKIADDGIDGAASETPRCQESREKNEGNGGAAEVAQLRGGQLPKTPTLSTEELAAKPLKTADDGIDEAASETPRCPESREKNEGNEGDASDAAEVAQPLCRQPVEAQIPEAEELAAKRLRTTVDAAIEAGADASHCLVSSGNDEGDASDTAEVAQPFCRQPVEAQIPEAEELAAKRLRTTVDVAIEAVADTSHCLVSSGNDEGDASDAVEVAQPLCRQPAEAQIPEPEELAAKRLRTTVDAAIEAVADASHCLVSSGNDEGEASGVAEVSQTSDAQPPEPHNPAVEEPTAKRPKLVDGVAHETAAEAPHDAADREMTGPTSVVNDNETVDELAAEQPQPEMEDISEAVANSGAVGDAELHGESSSPPQGSA